MLDLQGKERYNKSKYSFLTLLCTYKFGVQRGLSDIYGRRNRTWLSEWTSDPTASLILLTDMGISIILISSEMPELLAMCDRLVVLGKGVVQCEMLRGEANEINLMRAASCT